MIPRAPNYEVDTIHKYGGLKQQKKAKMQKDAKMPQDVFYARSKGVFTQLHVPQSHLELAPKVALRAEHRYVLAVRSNWPLRDQHLKGAEIPMLSTK